MKKVKHVKAKEVEAEESPEAVVEGSDAPNELLELTHEVMGRLRVIASADPRVSQIMEFMHRIERIAKGE